MHRILLLVVSVALLSAPTLGHAVSPEIVRAVAERPVTLVLESGGKIDGDVLSRGEASFVVVDTDGEVYEIAYEDVKTIRVRTATEASAEAAVVTARDDAAAAYEQASTREGRQEIAGDVSRALPAREAGTQSSSRLYARVSLDLGFGSFRLNEKYTDNWGDKASYSQRIRGLALGGDFALGAYVSESVAIHLNFGVRRIFVPALRLKDNDSDGVLTGTFGSTETRARSMNVGFGVTVLHGNLVFSASLGAGEGRYTNPGEASEIRWGLGGDVMLGYAMRLGNSARIGAALATTWTTSFRDDDDYKVASYSIGPRFFFMY